MQVRGTIDTTTSEVDIDNGVMVPSGLSVTATGDDLPCDIQVGVVLQGGRMVANEVTCIARNGDRITAEALRDIPVAKIVRLGVLSALGTFALAGKDFVALRKTGPSEETLRTVAAVYRLAYLIGDGPTAAVRGAFDVPKSTAARWVQHARARGFLGAADSRKAGESNDAEERR
ncbi:MAG: hypothetical protein M3P11_13005 [Actinomycetota bacterium]|nr:hypothetical protein [Actinomycetota bacterium]